ncbi:MAG: 50S ribosomal protein L6 [Planctomycetota bacterium]|jgi:large subunit ribosomal protein L6
MSRIGKKPIQVPGGVRVTIDTQSRAVTVEGPKGKLSMTHRPEVSVTWDEGENRIICSIGPEQMKLGQNRAYWGLTRSLIANMITGVTAGYTKKLEVVGVGWGAKLQGQTLQLNLGYSDPVMKPVPAGVEITVEGPMITVTGSDKQAVGQFAAVVRAARPPEPYNGKGIKYVDEVIIRKQGKVFGS